MAQHFQLLSAQIIGYLTSFSFLKTVFWISFSNFVFGDFFYLETIRAKTY
jgi:hypothetical protein